MSFLSQLNLTSNVQKSNMSDTVFEGLRQFIYDKTGIYFPDNKKYLLESRVGQRVHALGIRDYGEYVSRLRNGMAEQEIPQLVNVITINETFFYRNEPQLEIVETELLPQIIKRIRESGKRTVRIWSAASSSGEEPYTIALIVKEKLQPANPDIRFEIVGSDINTNVLNSARKATYRNYSIRKVPAHILKKYFIEKGEDYTLQPPITNMVEFRKVNLFDRNMLRSMKQFDIIFCANVLIYFDTKSKRQVIGSLYDSLNPGGFLLLGYSESLYGLSQAFKPLHFTKTIAYIKE